MRQTTVAETSLPMQRLGDAIHSAALREGIAAERMLPFQHLRSLTSRSEVGGLTRSYSYELGRDTKIRTFAHSRWASASRRASPSRRDCHRKRVCWSVRTGTGRLWFHGRQARRRRF